MLDERFGNWEVMEFDDFRENLFMQQLFVFVVTLAVQAFAHFLL